MRNKCLQKVKLIPVFIVLILMISVMGCNMMKGAGKDIENAGGSIQRTVGHND
ncbi:MAG: entericidin A/B family lipoprotein [Candidatus Aceula meridiana]|nr:entericidin A/B family lipoprotein [Candidatus Aceula meridiana]